MPGSWSATGQRRPRNLLIHDVNYLLEKEYLMNRYRMPLLSMMSSIAILGLIVFGSNAHPAVAQSNGQVLDLPCADGVSITPVGQALPDGASGQALAVLRAEFAPGGSLATHTHPGTLIVSVESGVFGFTMAEEEMGSESHNAMQIMRAATNSTPAAAEPVQAGTEYALNPGDWVVEPAGMVHSARGMANGPTVVLVTGLVAPDQPFIQCLDEASTS
jgi:quercetin dioxygenase-like cupin family protein